MVGGEIIFGYAVSECQCDPLRNTERSGTERIFDGCAVPNALTLGIKNRCLGSKVLDKDPHELRFGREAQQRNLGRRLETSHIHGLVWCPNGRLRFGAETCLSACNAFVLRQ